MTSTPPHDINRPSRTRFDWFTQLVSSAPGESTYLLIDQRHTLAQKALLRNIPLHACACLWQGSGMEANAALAPLLVRAGLEHAPCESLQALLEDEAVPHWSFVVLRSPHQLDLLARHLAAFKDYSVPGAEFEYVLHLADARVMQRLPRAFEPHRWQSFVGPLSLIAYLDRLGAPHQVTGPGDGTAVELPAQQPVMQLEAAEHRALVVLAYPDKLVAQLRTAHGDALQGRDYASLYFLVEELLREARQFGLHHEADLQAYVKAGAFLARHFNEHAAVAELLSAKAPPGSFASALQQLPISKLEEISRSGSRQRLMIPKQ